MEKKKLSPHALVATTIRKELKRLGLSASVRSSSYSMGNSVRVKILTPDLRPDKRREISSYCGQFQYGHFDGMIDLYEYSNTNPDLPAQVKFVFVDFEQSAECKQAIVEYLSNIGGMDDHHRDQLLWPVWSGSWGDFWTGFRGADVA